MLLKPASFTELADALSAATVRGERVGEVDLTALNRVVEHTPEDMTVTVEAGMTLAMLQAQLTPRGQWLPIDPPHPGRLTVGALLATNASGPRRFGCGTIREHVIGLKVALADGRLIKSGGKVVKNVAGYDLGKLFIGSHGSLGVIVEAAFKLRPRPEAEQFVQAQCESLAQAGSLVESVLESEITPTVLDLHNQPSTLDSRPSTLAVVVGFAGTREEVEWQRSRARELGISEPSNLEHEETFWADESAVRRWSVLPSTAVEAIRQLGVVPFVARAGNGVIYYRGGPEPPKEELPVKLMHRVKGEFDPKHILTGLPL